MVAAGDSHSVSMTKSGDVYCWGSSDDGQLGLGSANTEFVPRLLPKLEGKQMAIVACGLVHTIAIKANQTVSVSELNDLKEDAKGYQLKLRHADAQLDIEKRKSADAIEKLHRMQERAASVCTLVIIAY